MAKIPGYFPSAILVVALMTLLAGAQSSQGTPRIAYINSRDIIAQTPGREALAEQIRKEMAPFEARLKAIQDSDAAIMKKYQADEPTLTADARASRVKEITDKRTAWRVKADSITMLAGKRQEALEEPMTTLLKKILSDIRAEEGYWLIFDVAGMEQGGLSIVAIDKNMEITQRVVDKFKSAAAALSKAAAVPAGPPAGPVNSATGVGRTIPPPD